MWLIPHSDNLSTVIMSPRILIDSLLIREDRASQFFIFTRNQPPITILPPQPTHHPIPPPSHHHQRSNLFWVFYYLDHNPIFINCLFEPKTNMLIKFKKFRMVIPSQIGVGRIFPHFAVANCETFTYLILSKFSAITQLLVMTQLSVTRLKKSNSAEPSSGWPNSA